MRQKRARTSLGENPVVVGWEGELASPATFKVARNMVLMTVWEEV